MKKTLAIASLICTLALASCGGSSQPTPIGNPPPAVAPAVPTPTESQSRAQQLLGSWAFAYTLESPYSDSLNLGTVLESSAKPGEFFAAGQDDAGNASFGWYDFKYQTYVVTYGPASLTQFFEFPSIAADGSVSGVVWAAFEDGTYSEDFQMTGKRSLSAASLERNTMNVPLNSERAEQLFEGARAEWERSKR